MVNRIWQHHFGRGIVETPDDFGRRGSPPTHPELLDYLAARFIEGGWSVKAMHRLIVLSETYRMRSVEDPDALEKDPDNRWLWNFSRRRLDAEEVRDALLAVAGTLDGSPGGPHPFAPEWEWRYSQHHPFVDDFATTRRSVYLMQQRIRLQPMLAVFDGADTNAITGLRKASASPLQALFLMNDAFVHEQAARFADRVVAEGRDREGCVDRAYALAFGRPPADDERRLAADYLDQCRSKLQEAGVAEQERERGAWASYLRVLLSSNEFVFVE
jgi:hypothetical protein